MLAERTIIFDPIPHTYKDTVGNPYTSATQVIGSYEKVFNHRYWCMYTALKESNYQLRPDDSELYIYVNRMKIHIDDLYAGKVYLKVSIESINQLWIEKNQIACERGNKIHDFIENNIKLITGKGIADTKFNDFVFSNKVIFKAKKAYRTLNDIDNALLTKYPLIYREVQSYLLTGFIIYAELKIYHPDYLIAGTIDLVAINDKNEFVILDWKTNKKHLYFKAGYYKKVGGVETDEWIDKNETFKFPLNKVPFCKGEIYTLQLSLYSHILECWGFKMIRLGIYHMREDDVEKHIKIKYRKKEVQLMMEHHYNTIAKPKRKLISL